MTGSTVCYRCGTRYDDTQRARCDCGEPLWLDDENAAFTWESVADGPAMWRFNEMLPVTPPDGIARTAGGTELVRSSRLDDIAGCQVYVKDGGQNPTGSYKDRGSAVAIPHALNAGADVVGTVSYGNMAMSTAATAASLGHECIVLVPTDIPQGRLELIAQYDPTILQVEGDYGRLYEDALRLTHELPLSFLLSDAPARISGYRTAVWEIYESIGTDGPDAIVLPTSSGGLASGLWRGLLDMQEAGVVEHLPRLYLVHTAGSDPITRAFEEGQPQVEALLASETEETIAHSIGNPNPPSGTRALTAVRETGGAALSVSDDEIRTAQRQFAELGGFCVEPAAATPLAGAVRLSERGEIDESERVVLFTTGTGFKEMGIGDRSVCTDTVSRSALHGRVASMIED
jgi:threonine synthase